MCSPVLANLWCRMSYCPQGVKSTILRKLSQQIRRTGNSAILRQPEDQVNELEAIEPNKWYPCDLDLCCC